MTLNQLINHFKHNSMKIIILKYYEQTPLYNGTIGTYKTSLIKNKIGDGEFVSMSAKNEQIFIEIFLPNHIKRKAILIYDKGGETNE